MRMDGRREREMTKLIFAFLTFANVPNKLKEVVVT